MNAVDPLEQRDPWRTAWQVLTHDSVLAVLAVIVAAAALAYLLLPQAPAASDAIAFNQWVAQARVRQEGMFDFLQSLGANTVAESAWFRVAAAGLIAVALARLIDRLMPLIETRRGVWRNLDEVRARVTDGAPGFDVISQRLRARGYRVGVVAEQLHATRAPLADALSALLHIGAIVTALGVLLNIGAGWDAYQQALVLESAATINNDVTLTLLPGAQDSSRATLRIDPGGATEDLAPGQSATTRDVTVRLAALQSGYRIRATSSSGAPLGIRTSNYLSPTEDALVMFDEQGSLSVLVPDAQLVLTVVKGTPGEVQAFGIGSAAEIARVPVRPEIKIGATSFTFEPSAGALVDARRRPGNWPTGVGLALLGLGALGTWLRPMRRLRVKHHGHWTELYASGRGVRQDVIESLSQDTRNSPQSESQ